MKTFYTSLLCMGLLLSGCTTTSCFIPEGFADASHTAEGDVVCKAVGPQRVVYRIRHIEPESEAPTAFWHETLRIQLEKQGYRFVEGGGLADTASPAYLLRFDAPLLDEDYVYDILLLEKDVQELLLVEATGRKSDYGAVAPQIRSAMVRLTAPR